MPEFAIPKTWVVSEKVDGTNVRVIFKWGRKGVTNLLFRGKTDDAQLHPVLLKRLQELFTHEKLAAVFPDASEVILFGEGYGEKVNGIKGYGVEAEFILFDVVVKNEDEERSFKVPYWWLERKNVKDIAQKLGVKVVPEWDTRCAIDDASHLLRLAPKSIIAGEAIPVEGFVCRTEPMLLMRDGTPLMWKLKMRDFR